MKTRPKVVATFIPLIMGALLVASASALPVLSVNSQSNANYLLTALVQTTQSCIATPANFSGIACQNSPPGPVYIQVRDDGHCATTTDATCSFSPNSATVTIGQLVVWQNNGKLNHTVISDSPQYSVSLFLRAPTNSSGLGFIFSASASYAFASPGTFNYHDSNYPGMTGTITVNSIPAPAPIVRDFTATGPVNWAVVGLDQENALLSINHHVDVYNTTSNTHTLLASESGVFEDSINLSTRVESADLTRILNSLPYVYGYGYGGGYWPSPTILLSGPGTSYPISFYSPPEVYTAWWVNGPLFMGSTVEVLTTTGSVRGSQTLNLGTSLGSKDAWLVGSQFKEQFNQPPPVIPPSQNYPQYFVANNSVATSLQLDYGKASDLLLATSDQIDQSYQFGYIYPTGSILGGGGFYISSGPFPFFGGGGITLNQPVTVLRTQQTSLTLTLSLSSTNIDLNSNATPPINTHTNPTNPNPSPGTTTDTHPTGSLQGSLTPMLYTITGIIVTSLIGGVLWLVRRTRVSNHSLPQTTPPSIVPEPQPLT